MGLTLANALRVSSTPTIAFAGAGGKTTSIFQLARELDPPVIVTSTTHLGTWQVPLADKHIVAESPLALEEIEDGLRGILLVTGPVVENKTKPIDPSLLNWLREFCGYHAIPLLIEADGSRQKPLKAPAPHEPVIPGFVEQVVYVAGLSGMEKPLTEEFVHRPELFSKLSGLEIGNPISPEALATVLSHTEGGLKNIPLKSKRTLLLSQADTPLLQSTGGKLAQSLLDSFDSVLVGSLKENQPADLQVFEKISGIILAAGESKRYGKPKQLLDWRGQPFVRAVAQTALSAGLSPVIVVTGANAEQVETSVQDLGVNIIRNREWQKGQSSSIKAGISPLSQSGRGARGEGVGAAIFLLADQPQIGTDIIRALVERHTQGLYPVIAPLVLEEKRANPVLFDKITFPDLLKLEGDIGGRALFSKYKVEYMPWHDDRLLLDVDQPEDYQRLIDDETL
jgi:molybdenum cofactor cytidylyltransferase